jgi:hypothetical protein
MVDANGLPVEAAPNAAGNLQTVRSAGQVYEGSSPGDSIE